MSEKRERVWISQDSSSDLKIHVFRRDVVVGGGGGGGVMAIDKGN